MKAILIRAARTYLQALIGLLIASPLADLNISTVKTLLVSAAPAALSVVQNALEAGGAKLGPRG
jgi:hypothetical protein